MKNRTVYVPVSVEDRLPMQNGRYQCLCLDIVLDYVFYQTGHSTYKFPREVTHWLEKVELPTDEEVQLIAEKAARKYSFHVNYKASFKHGFHALINLLTNNQ